MLDWDGKVACTIYLAGCNFRCPYCHNRDIVLHPDSVEKLDEDSIMQYIEENNDFLDGAVISGGECTLDSDLVRLIRRIRGLNLDIKIDTNGTRPDVLDDIIGAGLVQKVAMDIKAPLDDIAYSTVAGVPVNTDDIRRSIGIIMDSGIDYEFRTTVVPVLTKMQDVESICKDIRGAKCYCLHQFRPAVTLDDRLEVLDPYPESTLLKMGDIAKRYVKQVRIRGI